MAATLFAEERVVVVGAVDGDVVGDALLTGHGEHIAVRTLRHGDAGREEREGEEVAAVVRQGRNDGLAEARGRFGLFRVDRCVGGADHHRRDLHCLACQSERLIGHLTESHLHVGTADRRESYGSHTHRIHAKGEECADEDASVGCLDHAVEVCGLVSQGHGGADDGISRGV